MNSRKKLDDLKACILRKRNQAKEILDEEGNDPYYEGFLSAMQVLIEGYFPEKEESCDYCQNEKATWNQGSGFIACDSCREALDGMQRLWKKPAISWIERE